MKSSPQVLRIRVRISLDIRVRLSSEPPQRSCLVLDQGVQNWSTMPWYAAQTSTPSNPAARQRLAAWTKPSMVSSISASVITWLPSESCRLGRPDADQLG